MNKIDTLIKESHPKIEIISSFKNFISNNKVIRFFMTKAEIEKADKKQEDYKKYTDARKLYEYIELISTTTSKLKILNDIGKYIIERNNFDSPLLYVNGTIPVLTDNDSIDIISGVLDTLEEYTDILTIGSLPAPVGQLVYLRNGNIETKLVEVFNRIVSTEINMSAPITIDELKEVLQPMIVSDILKTVKDELFKEGLVKYNDSTVDFYRSVVLDMTAKGRIPTSIYTDHLGKVLLNYELFKNPYFAKVPIIVDSAFESTFIVNYNSEESKLQKPVHLSLYGFTTKCTHAVNATTYELKSVMQSISRLNVSVTGNSNDVVMYIDAPAPTKKALIMVNENDLTEDDNILLDDIKNEISGLPEDATEDEEEA